jgi:hypothetical protein
MTIFLALVLAIISLALAVGVTIDYVLNRSPKAKRPRMSRLTPKQFEELKTWDIFND